MLSIYTTEKILSIIFKDNENKYEAWYNLIIKLKPNMRILLSIDTDYDYNDYNPVYMFQKDYDINVEPEYAEDVGDNSYINQIERMELESLSDPLAIFILDIDQEEAKKISEKYGIICHSFSSPAYLNPIFQECIEKSVDKDETRKGWAELFTGKNTTPSNYMVIIDRYLFSNDSKGITGQDGLNNISEILELTLPNTLGVDFHILIICDATVLDKDMTFNHLSSKINRIKNSIKRPYNIITEIVSLSHNDFNYDETHNRRIISNYYIMRVEHSIKAFKNGRGTYTQTIWLDWLASKGITTHKSSDAPAKALYRYTKGVINAVTQLKKKKGEITFSQNGNCNISIQNITHRII